MKNFKSRIPLGEGKWAFEQTDEFADSARKHIQRIGKRWAAPSNFYHLQKGGHVAAVRAHLNNHAFGKIDLRRFFQQVTRNRVVKRLVPLGYSVDDAVDFAVASTVRHGTRFALPYGFVQSPLLASIDLDQSALGRKIAELAAVGFCVTVYVDDIVISGADAQSTASKLVELRNAALLSKYEINEEKSAAVRGSMTAFNIEFFHGSMAVTEERLKEFAGEIYMRGNSPESIAIYGYVKTVNESQAAQLLADFPKQLAAIKQAID